MINQIHRGTAKQLQKFALMLTSKSSYFYDYIHTIPLQILLNKGEQTFRLFTDIYYSLTYTLYACKYPVY